MKLKPIRIGPKSGPGIDTAEIIGGRTRLAYVWIGRNDSMMTYIDARQMDALCRRWLGRRPKPAKSPATPTRKKKGKA